MRYDSKVHTLTMRYDSKVYPDTPTTNYSKTFIYNQVFYTSMGIAKVTTNYQVTIPKDVRRINNIKIGDTVLFSIEGNKVDFFKMERESLLKEIKGEWEDKIKGSSVDYVKELRKEWKKRAERLGI